jgi:hypothetical protein
MTTDKKPSRHPEQRTTWPHQANAPYFIYSRQQHINMLMTTDDLLPEHQHLLEIDFKGLGEGSTLDRQYWLANMDSAVRAATWQRNMELQRGRHCNSMACNDVPILDRK